LGSVAWRASSEFTVEGELLTALVKLGQDKTCEEAIRRFHIFFEDKNSLPLPPDRRKVSKCCFYILLCPVSFLLD